MVRALVVLLLVSSCAFDAQVPTQSAIRCPDGVCPLGFVCLPRSRLCVSAASTDRVAPGLLRATVSPPFVRRGGVVTVQLQATEALGLPPTAALVEQGRQAPLELVSSDGDSASFRATIGDQDVEGLATVTAELVDTAGNEAPGVVLGTVELDFTPPTVTRVDLAGPAAGDAGVSVVRPGQTLSARLTLSEPVDGPVVVGQSPCGALPFSLDANRAGLVTVSARLGADAGACRYELQLEAGVDRAGNAVSPAPAPLGHALVVDGTPPSLTAPTLARGTDAGWTPAAVFSRQPGFDVVGLSFDTSADVASVAVTFDGAPLACGPSDCVANAGGWRCTCTRAVSASDSPGAHGVIVSVADEAGNVATQGAGLRFDFQAPGLVASATQLELVAPPGCPVGRVTAAGPGATVRASFTLDELGSARLDSAPALPFTLQSASSPSFTAAAVVPASGVADGPVQLQVLATDEAGNTAALPLPALTVDATPPPPPNTASDGGVVLQRAPWGTATSAPEYAVAFASGAAPAAAHLLAYDGPTVVTANLLAFAAAPADGGVLSLALPRSDRAVVFVAAVDSACNPSPLVDVKDVAWRATFGGKRVGSTFENPHALEARRALLRSQVDDPSSVELDADALAREDGQVVVTGGLPTWRARVPRAHMLFAGAFDGDRDRLWVVGGQRGASAAELADETMGWDSRRWVTLAQDGPTLTGAAAAYDRARGELVVFGGSRGTAATLSGRTWRWDGEAWAVAAEAGPAPRERAAMAYDSVRQRVVLFGGTTTSSSALFNDVWEFDGVAWAQRDAGPGPVARSSAALAYDPARQRLVLHGGLGAAILSDTWELPSDGGWTLANSGGPATYAHALVFDEARGRMVMLSQQNNVYEWTGSSWTLRTSGPRVNVYGLAAGYDAARQRVVWFTGHDVRTWNGTTHQVVASSGPRDSFSGLQFDRARGVTVALAPRNESGTYFTDTFEWNGATWALRQTRPQWRTGPMTYDFGRGAVVQVSGWGYVTTDAGFSTTTFTDTLEWNGAVWAARPGSAAPPSFFVDAVGYDLQRGRLVGLKEPVPPTPTRVWELIDGGWSLVMDGGALIDSAVTDVAAGRVLSYGLASASSVRLGFQEWTGSAWLDRSMDAGPPATNTRVYYFDEALDASVVFSAGGSGGSTAPNTMWSWRRDGWFEHREPLPPPFLSLGATYDSARRQAVMAGLSPGGSAETWEYGVGDDTRPVQLATFDFFASSAEPSAVVRAVELRWRAGGTGSLEDGGARDGLDLLVWKGGGLRDVASVPAGTAATADVSWNEVRPAELAALFEGPRRVFRTALVPSANNGTGVPARVAADYVELVVRYRRP